MREEGGEHVERRHGKGGMGRKGDEERMNAYVEGGVRRNGRDQVERMEERTEMRKNVGCWNKGWDG